MSTLFHSSSEADTQRLGEWLAIHLPERAVVALVGTLGSGKTRLVQAIAEGCGVARADVTSPTFVLCQEHHGRRSLFHFDTYRLRDEQEFLDLGIDEYLARPGIVLIEWADRVADVLPDERLQVELEVVGETARRITLMPQGPLHVDALQTLAAEFAPPSNGAD